MRCVFQVGTTVNLNMILLYQYVLFDCIWFSMKLVPCVL